MVYFVLRIHLTHNSCILKDWRHPEYWVYSAVCEKVNIRHIKVCSLSSSGTWYFLVINYLISLVMNWAEFIQIVHFTFHFRIIASWNDRCPHLYFCNFSLYNHLFSHNFIELNVGGVSLLPKDSTHMFVHTHMGMHTHPHSVPLSSAGYAWKGVGEGQL